MKPYQPHDEEIPLPKRSGASEEELRVAITFKGKDGKAGPTRFAARMSTETVTAFMPDPAQADLALAELSRRGFRLTGRGSLTASMRCTRAEFESLFQTKLERMSAPGGAAAQSKSVLYPPTNAPWDPDPAVQSLLDDVYIQWPHIYMAKAARARKESVKGKARKGTPAISAVAPTVPYFHLRAPADIARHLNATPVHLQGITGKGVRVVMIDSGFEHAHPFFRANGYASSIALAPGAANRHVDGNGHGTGESANIFALAPGVTFIGVKVDNESNPAAGASILEGFQEALKHNPHVISVSLGYDLRGEDNAPLATLPNSLVALEAEIQAAVKRGVVVVFSAGNGHYSFPGQMPDVISAGGVFVSETGEKRASDYASAFLSRIYSGRSVPDVCGLVGLLPHANYLALPVPTASELDRDCATFDGTEPTDGWGVFSGTSAAAPQLAGLCALLLQVDPTLSPSDIKAILRRTARDVTLGNANPASDPSGQGIQASGGEDGATGAGLVDAYEAVKQLM